MSDGRSARGLLVLLAGLGVLLAGCAAASASTRGEAELEAQERLVAALQAQLANLSADQLDGARRGELRGMLDQMQQYSAEGLSLRKDLAGIEGEIRGYAGSRSAYRQAYRAWIALAAIGDTFPVLRTTEGRTFEEVEIRRVYRDGVSIRHRNGSAGLRYGQLPVSWQQRFDWEAPSRKPGERSDAERDDWVAARRAEIQQQTIEARAAELARIYAERAAAEAERRAAQVEAGVDEKLEKSRPLKIPKLRTARLHRSGRLGARRKVGQRR